MSRVNNVIMLSLDSSITPEATEHRKSQILSVNNPLKRFGALTLHNLITTYPELAGQIFDRELKRSGFCRLGRGFESVVYKQGDTVFKILQRSIDMPETLRQQLAQERTQEHRVLVNYMGSTAIRHNIIVDEHPINTDKRAVQIQQPFYDFAPLNIFEPDKPAVQTEELAEACHQYPGLNTALTDLVITGKRMYADTGLIPDTNGRSNFGVWHDPEPNLILVDSQPVTQEHAPFQGTILGQLGALEQGLRKIAA
ncbi:hypothetical protein BH23PAT1_BH23PAT1_4930 [soil metagenome]